MIADVKVIHNLNYISTIIIILTSWREIQVMINISNHLNGEMLE